MLIYTGTVEENLNNKQDCREIIIMHLSKCPFCNKGRAHFIDDKTAVKAGCRSINRLTKRRLATLDTSRSSDRWEHEIGSDVMEASSRPILCSSNYYKLHVCRRVKTYLKMRFTY